MYAEFWKSHVILKKKWQKISRYGLRYQCTDDFAIRVLLPALNIKGDAPISVFIDQGSEKH